MLVVNRGEICSPSEYEHREQDALILEDLKVNTLYEALFKLRDTKYADYGFGEEWALKVPVRVIVIPPSPTGMDGRLITLGYPDNHGNIRPPVLPCKIMNDGLLRPSAPLFYAGEIPVSRGYILPRPES